MVAPTIRSEEHTSELQSHSGISYAVFCLKKKKKTKNKKISFLYYIIKYKITILSILYTVVHLYVHISFFTSIFPFFFFFNDPATTEIYTPLYTLSLHDALPISGQRAQWRVPAAASAALP